MFPEHINTFVDVCGGSGTVLINTQADHYIYNDINPYVSAIFGGLIENDIEYIISEIEKIIAEYKLSMTNKEGFEQLRDDYNNGKNDWITLYTLMCFSFNYQFRFNSQHKYNSSFGMNHSRFTDRQRKDLYSFKDRMNGKDISISSVKLNEIDYSIFTCNDFLYFDPPYYNSVGNYNDGKRGFEGWTRDHETRLLEILDDLNDRNVKFALSHNLKYKNEILEDWKLKYNVHYLNRDYSNCSHNKIDRSKDIEVLITNY